MKYSCGECKFFKYLDEQPYCTHYLKFIKKVVEEAQTCPCFKLIWGE